MVLHPHTRVGVGGDWPFFVPTVWVVTILGSLADKASEISLFLFTLPQNLAELYTFLWGLLNSRVKAVWIWSWKVCWVWSDTTAFAWYVADPGSISSIP